MNSAGDRGEIAFTALVCALFFASTFAILFFLERSYILGADESVYLTKARSWFSDLPADQWGIYRPIMMPVYGYFVLHFGNSESIVRIFGIVFAALCPVSIFLLFRKAANLLVGVAAGVLVVSSSLFLEQAPQFLDDIPAATLLFLALYCILAFYRSNGTSSVIYVAVPLAALAFYSRYGAIVPIAIIVLASLLILFPIFKRSFEMDVYKLGVAALLSVVFFAPHFMFSLSATHNVLGVLSIAGEAAHRAYIGEGLVQYIQWLPAQIGGWPLGIFAIFGVFVTVVYAVDPQRRERGPQLLWLGTIGILSFVITGALVHAEARYVFFSMALLAGVGIAGARDMIARYFLPAAHAFVALAIAFCVYFGLGNFESVNASFTTKKVARANNAYLEVLAFIARNSKNRNGCAIWSAPIPALNHPRASWYAGCNVIKVRDVDQFFEDYAKHQNKDVYSVVYTKLREPQLYGDTAAQYGANLQEIYRIPNLPNGDLIVYRFTVSAISGDPRLF